MSDEDRNYYTVAEVANLLDVSDRTVRNMIQSGTFSAMKIDPSKPKSTYRISVADVDAYIDKRDN